MIRFLIFSCVFLTLLNFGLTIVCTDDICSTVKCDNATPKTCNGKNQVIKDGFCGCCKICYTNLDEGESCLNANIRGVPPTSGCKEGLKCTDGICKPVKKGGC